LLVLSGAKIVAPEGVLDNHWLRTDGARIAEIGSGPPPDDAVDVTGRWLVPGFVDTHTHGGGGADFGDATAESVARAVAAHRKHGTTTIVGSLVSAPIDRLRRRLTALRELVTDDLLAGVHVEGPFLSELRRGAHDPAALRDPDGTAVRALLDAGGDALRMITIAPERAGAIDAVRRCVDAGTIVAIGHTDATETDVRAAVDAGATVATHLFNGMRPLHHREPGPIGALLDDDRVTVELICDLVHLAPTTIHLAATHAGPHRTVLITDAMSATGLGDGSYELGGLKVTVRDGEPRLDDGGSLAGSVLTMDKAFANFVDAGMTISDAVAAASTHPARLLGLTDELGTIETGKYADLVLLDDELRLERVLRRGAWV
jgi:N-acetylglucosamine-6-phosphate deacetylase